MIPARIDLETVFAISKFFVTIPAARPYLVLLAFLIPSSMVLQYLIQHLGAHSQTSFKTKFRV